MAVSTHAPRAGSDVIREQFVNDLRFQLTLPEQGATRWTGAECLVLQFQLTLPERGATNVISGDNVYLTFQLTLPERGATFFESILISTFEFQHTLPERGATAPSPQCLWSMPSFNTRSPCGGATLVVGNLPK